MENPTLSLAVKCVKLISGNDLIGFQKPNADIEAKGGIELSHVNFASVSKIETEQGPTQQTQVAPFLPLLDGGLFVAVQFGPQHFMFSYSPTQDIQDSFRSLVNSAYPATSAAPAQAPSAQVEVQPVDKVPAENRDGILAADSEIEDVEDLNDAQPAVQ